MSPYHRAITRLSLIYAILLSIVAIFFSLVWFNVSTREIDSALLRQQDIIDRIGLVGARSEVVEARKQQLLDSRNFVLSRVLLTNFILLGLGGAGSYFLARRTLEPIEEAHKCQLRFTADASHELRTPLAAMQTEIEVALRDKKLTLKESKELLVSNLEELEKLKYLSNSLLQLARQDTMESVNKSYVEASAIGEKAVNRGQKLAKEKRIKFDSKFAKATINVDNEKIQDLLVILIENAVKYSPKNSTVKVIGKKTKGHYEFSVSDDGVGVRPADKERVFERFFRADNSRSKLKTEGYGLGLAIAKQIADLHGTKIVLKSTINKGSTFLIEFDEKSR
ncbi:MAG: HAMP domain-containing histidine kinase [bacterium]|nr:HAMP domain-containing histidine kinase [bacterium]